MTVGFMFRNSHTGSAVELRCLLYLCKPAWALGNEGSALGYLFCNQESAGTTQIFVILVECENLSINNFSKHCKIEMPLVSV